MASLGKKKKDSRPEFQTGLTNKIENKKKPPRMLSDVCRTNGISTSNKRFNNNSKQASATPSNYLYLYSFQISMVLKKHKVVGYLWEKQSSDNANWHPHIFIFLFFIFFGFFGSHSANYSIQG